MLSCNRPIANSAAPSGDGHAYTRELEYGVANGLAVARLCEWLARDGFVPDIVIGHNGWGEILYIKDLWPQTPLLGYFEFFYRASGSDVDFDREFPPEPDAPMRLRTRNALNVLGLDAVDWGQSPTEWQRSQYPERYRDRITVVHEGVDTSLLRPDPTARLWLSSGRRLSRADEVVTYSARDLEPYRGFHVFMRSLPSVLERRPAAQVLMVGNRGKKLRIEAFSIRPVDTLLARDIEFKALGPKGRQTPWVTDAKLCGTRGRGLPLTGFAIRLAQHAAERFDVVYQGAFFESGVAGPHRNGELCIPPITDDPLEAINVRLIRRSHR
ncbi:MAG: hypothetical protein E6G83_05275 [Alphaproteobacteria bacterium]|nr:MAG: hypothetical protein E6G83_05275 [Alphaproteobacteria bacterium]